MLAEGDLRAAQIYALHCCKSMYGLHGGHIAQPAPMPSQAHQPARAGRISNTQRAPGVLAGAAPNPPNAGAAAAPKPPAPKAGALDAPKALAAAADGQGKREGEKKSEQTMPRV